MTNTRAVASAEPVVTSTAAASASWWIRSPNSEISCPAHSEVNEPLSPSRTYGCRRTRSSVSGEGNGRVMVGVALASVGAIVGARQGRQGR